MSAETNSGIPQRRQEGSRKRVKPTIIDVAAAAGVSKSTVSRVLQKDPRVADQTREAVQKAITELGYIPAFSAQLMRSEPAPTIGLFSSSIDIPIFAQLNRYLHEGLTAQGFYVIQQTIVHPSREDTEDVMKNLARMPIQGMVVSVGGADSELLGRFADRLPLVVMGRPEPTGELNAVGFDEAHNARLIIDHLMELGHERIMLQDAPKDRSMGTWSRVQAQKEYAEAKGLHLCCEDTFGMHGSELQAWVERTINRGFTAIVSLFDRKALEVIRAANSLGFNVPEDVSVTGSDGVLDGLDLIGLTTIRKPVDLVGRRSAQSIVALVKSPELPAAPVRELYQGELVVGSTTSSPS